MIVYVFNVGHGFCAYLRDHAGNNMLLDCGHSGAFYPTDFILKHFGPIQRFFVLNYDEDHLSGLPHLIETAGWLPVTLLHRNRSVSLEQLIALKLKCGPLGPGLKALAGLIRDYTVDEIPIPATGGPFGVPMGASFQVFANPYPLFDDTNNLSLAIFVHLPQFTMLFPGDLEKAGWRALLAQPAFVEALARTRVLVASHHGRKNGYVPEVFRVCRPDVVLISDEPMEYESQEHCYGDHAIGLLRCDGAEVRRVITTRCDGHIAITAPPDCLYRVTTFPSQAAA